MEAFHSLWTRPRRLRGEGPALPDYETLTAMLSALTWRSHTGRIRMVTDAPGAEYLRRCGLEELWDLLDVSLDAVPETVDAYLFWAAGKLYALRSVPCPCVMLDTDLIVWENVEKRLAGFDAVCAHREDLDPAVYPDPAGFTFREGYSLPADWDLDLRAANTAFLFLRDGRFRDAYTDAALDLMAGLSPGGRADAVTAMCFAEQRVLPMCAKAEGKALGALFEPQEAAAQTFVTHTWGFKRRMERFPEERRWFCEKCVRRILRDFPAWEDALGRNGSLKPYYEAVKKNSVKKTSL